jgi:hypothetical protein
MVNMRPLAKRKKKAEYDAILARPDTFASETLVTITLNRLQALNMFEASNIPGQLNVRLLIQTR